MNNVVVHKLSVKYSCLLKIEQKIKILYYCKKGKDFLIMEQSIFNQMTEIDKEKLIKKHGLIHENNGWYSHRENSHKHLIFKDEFYNKSDIIGLLFRLNKLCAGKVNYFRKNIDKYEPCKYHYKDGFITVPLWDADFLRHKASGYILDFKYLETIIVYEDFVSLYEELEEYENK